MSSLSAITSSSSTAFIAAPLSSPAGIGAADAFGLDRGDLAGLERNLPGAAHVAPPLPVFFALGLAHEFQRGVLALHAGDGKRRVLLRLRHDERVGHDIG